MTGGGWDAHGDFTGMCIDKTHWTGDGTQDTGFAYWRLHEYPPPGYPSANEGRTQYVEGTVAEEFKWPTNLDDARRFACQHEYANGSNGKFIFCRKCRAILPVKF